MAKRLVAALAVLVTTSSAVLVAALPAQTARAAPAPLAITTADVMIPSRDGIELDAYVSRPAQPGRYPLVVMPGTFGGDFVNTRFIGDELAGKGYVTINYNERGIGGSGGEIDGGGPKDVADVSAVVDWALANLPVEPGRIGAAAQSYGGGIAVLAAAFDPRIRAVVNIAGWVDLEKAVFQNGTRAVSTLQLVQLVSSLFGRLSADARTALDAGMSGENIEPALRWARERSAATYLDRYAVHRPALYMSHNMNETLAPIDSTLAFYDAYPGPKHEDLRNGDHGGHELLTPAGVRSITWDDGFRWLDRWLKDEANGIDTEPAVRVVPRSAEGSRPAETYATTAVRRTSRHHLVSAPGLFTPSTTLAGAPGTGTATLRPGINLLLHVPIPGFSYAGEVFTGRPLSASLLWVDRNVTGVWVGPALAAPVQVRGEARVHLQVTPSTPDGTVTAYLLDVAEDGDTAFIVAQAPHTFRGAAPGVPLSFDVRTPYNAYDLPAGHRLAVAVSTGDPTYANENADGSTLRIGAASYVDVPLR